ncbi:MAG: hypothetical protein M1831_001654 [Alyxoria varia]|nr:MAG: hypothetical protein M1831_001654 [Alyxoria varia]
MTSSKGSTPPGAAPDISIVGDQVTLYPTGYTESPAAAHHHDTHDRNLVEHMARFRESPYEFLREISLHVQGSGWRSYENIVGQPIYYNGFSDNMKAAVMATPMLQAKIAELAATRVSVEEEQGLLGARSSNDYERKKAKRRSEVEQSLRDVAEKWTDQMICKMESKRFIRGAYYLATSVITRAYHQGIHVSSEEVLRLRAVAEKAAKNKQSIIFLPCHRSHVDYVSLQLICYRLGLALPTVVAGDNLNFPLLGPFLQHAGAMWIRRSFGDDQLYVCLVQSYIDTLLKHGFNLECFVEGGRSRMGKLLPPKFGILSFLLDSVMSGRVGDAIVCPVSTQYDKVIEVDSYISELLGTPKAKENLSDFLSASSVMSLQLGRVDVRFHEPWSLSEFIQQQQTRFDNLSQTQQADLNRVYHSNLRTRLLRTLGYKVLADINAVSVVMPTSLIGTVLLTLRGRGVGRTELIRRVEWLSDRVRAQGGRVAHFAGQPTETVVQRGLEVLGPDLIGVQKDVAEETYFAVDRFQLSFYRNMLIHLFVNQALVSASMYTQIKAGGAVESQAITYGALLSQVSFLSQLFRGEFIFPTAGLSANLAETINGLETEDIIKVHRTKSITDRPKNSDLKTNPMDNPDSIEKVELSDLERTEGRNNFDFYCFLIWPFIEASWLGAVSLMMLTPPSSLPSSLAHLNTGFTTESGALWLDDRAFQSCAQHLGKTLFAQGDLSYFEAVNKETLKNAYQRFEEEGIIVTRKIRGDANKSGGDKAKGPVALVRLADEWMPQRQHGKKSNGYSNGNRDRISTQSVLSDIETGERMSLQPQGRLWEFCEEISQSRLEGKNRRDGDAVVKRVLRLVDTVADGLWNGPSNVVSIDSEILAQLRRNTVEWKGTLSDEAYLRREAQLADQDLTRSGGLSTWLYVQDEEKKNAGFSKDTAPSRRVLAGCETIRKRALVASYGNNGAVQNGASDAIKVEEVIAHGVASVFVPEELRGKGYGGMMIAHLGRSLKNWKGDPSTDNEKVAFSVLYSDVGKKFYAKHGWQPHRSSHIRLPVGLLAHKTRTESNRLRTSPVVASSLPGLVNTDCELVRRRLPQLHSRNVKYHTSGESRSSDRDLVTIALVPDLATIRWHHAREDFVAEELFGKDCIPEVKGAIVEIVEGQSTATTRSEGDRDFQEPSSTRTRRVWAIWNRLWRNRPIQEDATRPYGPGNFKTTDGNTLHILRLVVEPLYEENPEAELKPKEGTAEESAALAAVLQAALSEAVRWGMSEVEIWNPTRTTAKATELVSANGEEINVVDREEDEITSLKWLGESEPKICWEENTRFGWC